MLVLERLVGQTIELAIPGGATIVVMLVDIDGTRRAKIGITAPKNIGITRDDAVHKFPKKESTDAAPNIP